MELQLNYKISGIFLLLAVLIVACGNSDPNAKYKEEVREYRKEVLEFFKTSEDSPTVDMTEKVEPIFYEPNSEFRVEAYLEKFPNPDTLEMLTTQSDVRKMIRYGQLKFKLHDDKFVLNAYVNIEHPESFFIPFLDKTSGDETYEAGRYLDINRSEEAKYILDFNLAYNPYCYYNAKYSCPIVPEDNYLNTKIEAGEKAHNENH